MIENGDEIKNEVLQELKETVEVDMRDLDA